MQHYGSDVLDASILLMPLVLFIAPRDPRWLSTLDAIGDELVSDSLVYRYNLEASPDGLQGDEGTFSMCSFWYVEALTRAGRVDEARLAFEKMLTYANHLGLYAEEIGPTGEQLGNFPQAFTHLALISAAYNLDQAPRVGVRHPEEEHDARDRVQRVRRDHCRPRPTRSWPRSLEAHLRRRARLEDRRRGVAELVADEAYEATDS